MNNASAILKALVLYAVCVPLAIWLGFLVAGPLSYSTLGIFGIVAMVLAFPLLMRWHYPLMLLSWSAVASMFFLPGRPSLWMVMIALSFGISLLQRALEKDVRFIHVPQVTLPLLFLVVVVLVTAKFTGGFGLKVFGSDVYGGKKFVTLLLGIVGYFALTARRIPPERAKLYVGLFFLGGVSAAIGDMYTIIPSWLNFIFWVFSPNLYFGSGLSEGINRFSGAVATSFAVFAFMLARYGLRGIFLSGKPWRWLLLLAFSAYGLLGGFRSIVIVLAGTFALQFYLEGLHRTKLLPIFAAVGVLGMALLVPLASHLPYTFQRSLAFLPVNIDPVAKADAQGSIDWRIAMWKSLWPEVPHYLLLGKGYAFDKLEYSEMGRDTAIKSFDAGQQGLALAGDYHNGPLSLLLPFGIWGALGFVWFLAAGISVLNRNFKYGDPALKTINALLLAAFLIRALFFFVLFGAVENDMLQFAGWLGLSVALNGGVCSPATQHNVEAEMEAPEHQVIPFRRPKFQPAFQRLKG